VYCRDASADGGWWRCAEVAAYAVTVRGLANGHSYEFKVTGYNVAGEGPASGIVRATPVPPAPQAPSNLIASAGNGYVSLSWTASPSPNVYYWVYIRPQGQSAWYYLRYPVSGTSVTVKPLWNGFSYDFKVTAANLAGQSAASNTVTAKPMPPVPAAPSNLSGTGGPGSVTLSWTASSTPNVYY
jgi:hypothetical protein